MPAHPVALALLREAARLGVPGVAAPSANRFGRVSPTTAAHVRQEFGDALLVLDGGACEVGIESAIVDCTRQQPALLRPGSIGRAASIEAVLGACPLAAPDAASPRASGTLASHYAPGVPVQALPTPRSARPTGGRRRRGAARWLGVYSRLRACAGVRPGSTGPCRPTRQRWRTSCLRCCASSTPPACAAIWVERPPPGPEWDGVRDRLQPRRSLTPRPQRRQHRQPPIPEHR
jgi:L-threonylcarbamoyladenylate synthase